MLNENVDAGDEQDDCRGSGIYSDNCEDNKVDDEKEEGEEGYEGVDDKIQLHILCTILFGWYMIAKKVDLDKTEGR